MHRADAAHPAIHAHAFLVEFAPVRDTHALVAVDLDLVGDFSIDDALAGLSDGSIEPKSDTNDDPSWQEALASLEREYWIAGGREELKSLEDLNVFVLVPWSEVPRGQRPLKGKLVCKCKCDDQGNVI
jgi:hypothetical protein